MTLMIAMALIGSVVPVAAEGPQAEVAFTTQPQPNRAAHSGRKAANGFDWLASTRSATPQPATLVREIGTGSYICAPAGFGRKSRCYAN